MSAMPAAGHWDVAIRTDGTGSLGTGHVVRCCSIAAALREAGASVGFVCSDDQSSGYIRERGFSVIVTGGRFDRIEEGIEADKAAYSATHTKVMLLDTLFATADYLNGVRGIVKTCVITPSVEVAAIADAIINYSGYKAEDYYAASGIERRMCLFGMSYAPLGTDYWGAERNSLRSSVGRMLLSSGGTDSLGVLPALLAAIDEHDEFKDVTKDVVVGRFAKYPDEVLEAWSSRKDIEVHIAPRSLFEIQKSCDLAATAAGTTIYELFALGVPTVCYAIADNQLQVGALDGKLMWCGDVRKGEGLDGGSLAKIANSLSGLLPYENRAKLVEKTSTEVDFSGARRIAKKLIELAGK